MIVVDRGPGPGATGIRSSKSICSLRISPSISRSFTSKACSQGRRRARHRVDCAHELIHHGADSSVFVSHLDDHLTQSLAGARVEETPRALQLDDSRTQDIIFEPEVLLDAVIEKPECVRQPSELSVPYVVLERTHLSEAHRDRVGPVSRRAPIRPAQVGDELGQGPRCPVRLARQRCRICVIAHTFGTSPTARNNRAGRLPKLAV